MLLNISDTLRAQILIQKFHSGDDSHLAKIAHSLPEWIKKSAETCKVISIPKNEFNQLSYEVQECFVAVPFHINQ